jgi:hypothetical protein
MNKIKTYMNLNEYTKAKNVYVSFGQSWRYKPYILSVWHGDVKKYYATEYTVVTEW